MSELRGMVSETFGCIKVYMWFAGAARAGLPSGRTVLGKLTAMGLADRLVVAPASAPRGPEDR